MNLLRRLLITSLPMLGLIGLANAATEEGYVAGSVMTKGLLGILISLGIENWVTATQAMFLYNLISVCCILVIAAMSGPRSEAAFCIVVPIFAGMFMWFGWLKLATASETTGLFFLIICMALFGIALYMNDQNKQNYGTVGPGSKLFNLAFFIMFFSIALTMVSGFSIFPVGGSQPIPGSCSVGFTCDQFNNIDFTSTANSLKQSGGMMGDVTAMAGWTGEMAWSTMKLMFNIIVGVFLFSAVINQTMSGLFPGIASNAAYIAIMIGLQGAIWLIYAQGIFEWFSKAPVGSTL